MAQVRQLSRVQQDSLPELFADVQTQVAGWGGGDANPEYVGHGYLEFTDENGERVEMVSHRCSCGQLFATWAETGELDECPGCGANVSSSLA